MGRDYEFVLAPHVRSIVCSTHPYRDVDNIAGHLACIFTYQGMFP